MKNQHFINASSLDKFNNVVKYLKSIGYKWATDFPNLPEPTYEEAKSYYHRNSKLVIHSFYNDITRKYEFSYGTYPIYTSYPQYSKLKRNEIIEIEELIKENI